MAIAVTLGCLVETVAAAAQTASLGSKPILLDRKRTSGLLVSQVTPDYPPLAKVNYIQGQVRMQIMVTPEGRVSEAHAVHGHPFLAASALKAVRHWVYRPFLTSSGPTAFQTFVDVHFSLRPRKIDQVPVQPERDLTRQIRLPRILERPTVHAPTVSVRLHVLVSDDGEVLDTLPVAGLPAHFNAAQKNIEHWTFRPARWGALAVPWYLDVDVPVEDLKLHGGAGDRGGQ